MNALRVENGGPDFFGRFPGISDAMPRRARGKGLGVWRMQPCLTRRPGSQRLGMGLGHWQPFGDTETTTGLPEGRPAREYPISLPYQLHFTRRERHQPGRGRSRPIAVGLWPADPWRAAVTRGLFCLTLPSAASSVVHLPSSHFPGQESGRSGVNWDF